MMDEERDDEIRGLVASGMSQRVAAKRYGLSKSVVGRIVHGRPYRAYRRRPGGELGNAEYDHTLEAIADEIGLTRERVRQIEAGALVKLGSREHLARTRNQLRRALADLREMRREGATIEAELTQALHIEDLMAAVDWLEAGRSGELRAILDSTDERCVPAMPSSGFDRSAA